MNFKIVFTSLLFTLLFISQSFAQDVYEYATVYVEGVRYSNDEYDVIVTKDTIERTRYVVHAYDRDTVNVEKFVIVKLHEMNKQGWEVYSACKNTNRYTAMYVAPNSIYYLRKKIMRFEK